MEEDVFAVFARSCRESLEGVQMQQRSTEKMKKRRKRRWREPEGEGEHRDTLGTGRSSVYSI